MIVQVVVSPWVTLYTLPKSLGFLCLVLTAIFVAPSYGIHRVHVPKTVEPEVGTAVIVTTLVVSNYIIMLYYGLFHRIEDNFDTWPWANGDGNTVRSSERGEAKKSKKMEIRAAPCPFTGLRPNMRCPSCDTYVNEAGFHFQDKMTTFIVGENTLLWDKASEALKKRDIPMIGRAELDEALDCRGNYFFGAVGNCCKGCAAWHRNFLLVPRWALVLSCLALIGAYVPWSFTRSLKQLDSDPRFPGAGGRVQAMAMAMGMFYAVASLLLQLHALACAALFVHAYKDRINFPVPVSLDLHWLPLARFFAGKQGETVARDLLVSQLH